MDLKGYIQLTAPAEFTRSKNKNRNPTLNHSPNPETKIDKHEKEEKEEKIRSVQ